MLGKTVAALCVVAVVLASCVVRLAVHAQDAKAARSRDEIHKELQAAAAELRVLIRTPADLFDEAKRGEMAPQLVPVMKKTLGLFEELAGADEAFKGQFDGTRRQFLAMLSLLGDEASTEALAKDARSTDADRAVAARSAQLVVRWWKNGKSAAEQGKVLDETGELAATAPENEGLAEAVAAMHQQGAATPEVQRRLEAIVTDQLKGNASKALAETIKSERRLREVEGKPLVLEGTLIDGKKFSTAEWKGKVVLVDFWATWCGPCVAELPKVKKAYAQFHVKGLEIVGVSCDQDLETLKAFVAGDKGMTWPQMFEPGQRGWHPLAEQHGVQGIPTMFLIDRKGICRTVKGRQKFEEMIPKLLEEKSE